VSPQTPDNPSIGDNSLNGNVAHRIDPGSNEGTGQDVPDNAIKGAESVARMVFSFVSGAQDFVRSMDGTDDMRLLRLRTRKNEIMIVPGVYIMSLGVRIADITGRSQVSPRGHTRCTPGLKMLRVNDSRPRNPFLFACQIVYDTPGSARRCWSSSASNQGAFEAAFESHPCAHTPELGEVHTDSFCSLIHDV
jgi:hypothetical protein